VKEQFRHSQDLCICSLDYVKAFDKVQHKILTETLELLVTDGKYY